MRLSLVGARLGDCWKPCANAAGSRLAFGSGACKERIAPAERDKSHIRTRGLIEKGTFQMEPIIWTLLLIGTLIGGGVSLSVYLYTRGVVGAKRSAHWQTPVTESALEDTTNDDQFYMNMST